MKSEAGNRPEVVVWMNFPSHHQSAFFRALEATGVRLRVVYYGAITPDRLALGWRVQGEFGGERIGGAGAALRVLREHPDALHVIPGYGSRITAVAACGAAWQRIAWAHWSEPAHPGVRWWIDWPRKWLYAQLVNRRGTGALAIGLNAQSDFERWGVRRAKIRQLPYSRRRDAAPVRCPVEGRRLIFGFVGVINERKGVDAVVRAFGAVAREFPGVGLLLVGRNDFGSSLERMIGESGAPDGAVEVRPPIAASEVERVMEAIDVFVMPSRFDGWGVALQEAALAGCALISTCTCGAARHLISDGENGVLLERCAVEPLARAIRVYASAPSLAQRHGAVSQRLAAGYTPDANAARFVRALADFRSNP